MGIWVWYQASYNKRRYVVAAREKWRKKSSAIYIYYVLIYEYNVWNDLTFTNIWLILAVRNRLIMASYFYSHIFDVIRLFQNNAFTWWDSFWNAFCSKFKLLLNSWNCPSYVNCQFLLTLLKFLTFVITYQSSKNVP